MATVALCHPHRRTLGRHSDQRAWAGLTGSGVWPEDQPQAMLPRLAKPSRSPGP